MEKKIKPVNLYGKVAEVEEIWLPVIAAEMNGYHFKLARIKGEYIWHRHDDTDEVFFVLKGKMKLYFHDQTAELSAGDLLVVPKDVEHKPVAFVLNHFGEAGWPVCFHTLSGILEVDRESIPLQTRSD